MITKFNAEPNPPLGQLMLSLATWLYHYCQVGAAVMVAAVSLAAWRTRVLPVWMAALGVPVIVLTLLHTWIPLVAALSSLNWIGVVSLLMLVGLVRAGDPAAASGSARSSRSPVTTENA